MEIKQRLSQISEKLTTKAFYKDAWQNIKRWCGFKFYRMKKVSISEVFFIDFRTVLSVSLLLAATIYLFYPSTLVIDFPSLDNERSILDAVVRTVSILFGIIFSFIFLSFNIFNKHFGRYAFVEFFKDKLIRRPFTLLLCTICFILYALSYLKEATLRDAYGDALYLLSILLAIFSFFFVFPSIFKMMKKSQSRNNINDIVQRLGRELDHEVFEVKYLGKTHDIHYKDPIQLLKEIGVMAIKEYDTLTIGMITKEFLKYFEQCAKIGNKDIRQEKLTIYRDFTTLYIQLFRIAVKERNTDVALILCNARFNLEQYILKNLNLVKTVDHNGKYMMWDLNHDVERYFDRAVQYGEDDVAKEIIEAYRDFIVQAIPLLVPKDLVIQRAFTMDLNAITGAFHQLGTLGKQIISYKKIRLFKALSNTFYTVVATIDKADITDSAKAMLFTVLTNVEFEESSRYVSLSDVTKLESGDIPFKFAQWTINSGGKYRFERFVAFIQVLLHEGKLTNAVLNTLKADVMGLLSSSKDNAVAKELAFYGISALRKFSVIITESDSDYRKEMYLKAEKYLRILWDHCIEQNILEDEVINNLKAALQDFTHKADFEKDLKSKGHVFDENIL